jgi:hypothetical protein
MALVAGCDRQAERSDSLQPEAAPQGPQGIDDAPVDGVRLALLEPGGDTDLARLEGILSVDGRCLYIAGNDKTKNRTLPAFALAGVRWDSGTRTLRAGDKVFAQGQRIVLGGGEPANPAALNWLQRPDPSCDASDLFVVGTVDSGESSSGR